VASGTSANRLRIVVSLYRIDQRHVAIIANPVHARPPTISPGEPPRGTKSTVALTVNFAAPVAGSLFFF
jgi:hypothetical protein